MVKIKKDLKKSTVFLLFFILSLLVIIILWIKTSNKVKNINCSPPSATITELTVSNSNTKLLAYFTLNINDPAKLKQILMSGVPIKFIYYLRLYIPHTGLFNFFNKDIADKILIKTVNYDSIKGTYQVHTMNMSNTTLYSNSFKEVLADVCQINDLPITSLNNLEKGKTHILKVKVEAKKILTSIPFKDILTIFSSDIFETKWYEIKFTY